MSFITYLITGLSMAASPGQPGARTEARLLRVDSVQTSAERGAPAAVAAPRDRSGTEETAPPRAQPLDPEHHAKAQKHYDPSHKEATETRAGRSKKAQRKRSATARQRAANGDVNAAGNGDATAPNRPK